MRTEYYPATKYRPNWRKTYADLRSKGWRAGEALRHAKVYAMANNELDSLVRLVAVADEICSDPADYVDTWNDTTAAYRSKVKKEIYSRVESEGMWGCVAQFRLDTDSEWIDADSVWGFIGDDFVDSGYDADLLQSAIDAREAYVNACN